MPADRPWTNAELIAVAAVLDRQETRDAAAVLDAAAPLIAARATADERTRIDTALRALPCPDGERPGARITADEHYRWMTDVLAVVHATTGEDHDHD